MPHTTSLTLDPLSLLVGEVLLGLERNVGRLEVSQGHAPVDVSVRGVLGAGVLRHTNTIVKDSYDYVWERSCVDAYECERFTRVTGMVQALVYPVGSFVHGLQTGAEARFLWLWGTRSPGSFLSELSDGAPPTTFSGGAFAPGFLVGYKLATNVGFTFNAQLAIDVAIVTGHAPTAGVGPRSEVDVGWSF